MSQIAYPNVNQTGFYGLSQYVADATQGFFWLVMLLVLWVIVFVNTKQYSSSRAFTLASFLASTGAIILSVVNLISSHWAYLSILMVAGGAIWIKFEE